MADRLWRTIADRAALDCISGIRRTEFGVNCTVDMWLTIDSRTALARTAWHYSVPDDSPRLVTAYPRL